MKNCSRAIALNSASERRGNPSKPDCVERIDAALIDPAPSKAYIDQAAKSAFLQAALPDARFEFGDAVLNELSVQGGLRRHALWL